MANRPLLVVRGALANRGAASSSTCSTPGGDARCESLDERHVFESQVRLKQIQQSRRKQQERRQRSSGAFFPYFSTSRPRASAPPDPNPASSAPAPLLRHAHSHEGECKRWALTLAVAAVTAGIAVTLTFFTAQIVSAKFYALDAMLDEADTVVASWLAFSAVNALLVACSAAIVVFAAPVAAGSGIPEIKCLLNGIKIPFVVRVRTLLAKAVGVVLSVGGGLPVGKEGPMIHSGAVVGAGLSQGKSTTCGFDTGFSKTAEFRNDREKNDFVVCGAAAGVAAAFGAPIGGTLFCLEEGASWWSPSLTWRTFASGMASTLLVDLFLSSTGRTGHPFGTLAQPGMLSFGSFVAQDAVHPFQVWELGVYAGMGIVAGVLGALFNAINERVSRLRHRTWCRSRPRIRLAEAVVLSLLVSAAAFAVPAIVGPECIDVQACAEAPTNATTNGTTAAGYPGAAASPLPPTPVTPGPTLLLLKDVDLRRFTCPHGKFDAIATVALNPGDTVIKYLFHASEKCGPSPRSLALFGPVYLLLACLVYGLGVPSGLFVPGILGGAAYGRLVGTLLAGVHGVYGGVSPPPSSVGCYALVGAAAMLGGISRLGISLTVILIECTGDIKLAVPCMVAVLAARWSGNMWNDGIYEMHIRLREIPFLHFDPPRFYSDLRVARVMTREPLVLRPVERVSRVLRYLRQTPHNAFPVVSYRLNTRGRAPWRPTGGNTRSSLVLDEAGAGSAGEGGEDEEEGKESSDRKAERPSGYMGLAPPRVMTNAANGGQTRRLCGLVLRKHLGVLLSDRFKSRVLMPNSQFVEIGQVVKRNKTGAGGGSGGSRKAAAPENKSEGAVGKEKEDEKEDEQEEDEKEGDGGTRVPRDSWVNDPSRFLSVTQALVGAGTVGLPQPLVGNFDHEDGSKVLSWTELESRYPRYLPHSENMTREELESWVDLRPYLNEAPTTIADNALVTQAYRLFRSLGLRHLCAVDTDGDVVGVLTRHDLVESHVEECWEIQQQWQLGSEEGGDGGMSHRRIWNPTPRHRLHRNYTVG